MGVSPEVRINEADNALVVVTLSLDGPARSTVSAPVTITGSATRDYDYVTSGESFEIGPGETASSIDFDIFRDFDVEGNESILVEVGELMGEAELNGQNRVAIDIVDGGSAVSLKTTDPPEPIPRRFSVFLLIWRFDETELRFLAAAGPDRPESLRFSVELSTNIDFTENVRALHQLDMTQEEYDQRSVDGLFQLHSALPFAELRPNTHYYLRGYFGEQPDSLDDALLTGSVAYAGFATNAEGRMRARCQTPERIPGASGTDPLFDEQWHLVNTGQTSFSKSAGVPGADLRMRQAIEDGLSGVGVKVLVFDSGLEICHPDLAANVIEGASHRFSFDSHPGTLRTDPFNFTTLGDHGTSVAGVIAAVAGNGLGGRGVAPGVDLVGYTRGADVQVGVEDTETDFFKALGGSSDTPDSASMDVFNMSLGTSGYVTEDLIRLYEHGTSALRSSLGALYVKAAGNSFERYFDRCIRLHPLNKELGCVNSNADPHQNLPYLLTIGGFNASDVKSSYASVGANLWVVGPTGEYGFDAPAIITTDQAGTQAGYSLYKQSRISAHGDYTSLFSGTSAAAPAVAGVIALVLEANPNLSWRDIKHLLAVSARKIDTDRPAVRVAFKGHPYVAQYPWLTNAAGYEFHNWYGFGAASVDAAVDLAGTYQPGSLGTFAETPWFDAVTGEGIAVPDADGEGASQTLAVDGLPQAASIEAVTLGISVDHEFPEELGITLISPSGTPSVLNPPFNRALGGPGLNDWRIMSNAFYGESPNGEWTLNVVDLAEEDEGVITDWRLKFHYGEHDAGAASGN